MLDFKISDLLHSDIANEKGINNFPENVEVFDNILNLIVYVLQPMRISLGRKIIVDSGYRCKTLNDLLGSNENSEHRIGCAVDIMVEGMTPREVWNWCKENVPVYNQCLLEYDEWVHLSFQLDQDKHESFEIN